MMINRSPLFVIGRILRWRVLLALLWSSLALDAGAAALTVGNILVSENQTGMVHEYTTAGTLVQSFTVPAPGDGSVRDVVVDRDGNIRAFNGTFDPDLATINVLTSATSQHTASGWSTISNGTYGGIATIADNGHVFVSDMRTFGPGDTPDGVVVFDESGAFVTRITDTDVTPGPTDITIGLDGLLYALHHQNDLAIYHPLTFSRSGSLALGGGIDFRSIAVNANGESMTILWRVVRTARPSRE